MKRGMRVMLSVLTWGATLPGIWSDTRPGLRRKRVCDEMTFPWSDPQ